MVGVGVAWASILAMPYAMLSNALPPEKMGFYMGVFNFFIVLPQILASVGLGFVMEHFLGNDATQGAAAGRHLDAARRGAHAAGARGGGRSRCVIRPRRALSLPSCSAHRRSFASAGPRRR